MSINFRRISALILIAMCLLVPSVTPAQASGPYFYTLTFTGTGTCTSTTIDAIPFTESFNLPAGTVDTIFKVNGVAFGKPFHQDLPERIGGGNHTTDYNVPSTTLPYTLTQEVIYHSTAGKLIIHVLITANCRADGIATATFTDLLNTQGETPLFNDGRINPDAGATIVGYCDKNGGIEAYLPNGRQIFKVTAEQIETGLKQAVDSHKNILIKQASGQQLWALASNQLQFHDARGNGYNAIFTGDHCGE